MLFLSSESLQYAVNMCSNNKNYNVGMVLSDESLESTVQELNTTLLHDECKIRSTNINSVEVIFSNGSYMLLLPESLNNNIGRFRYHLIILDEKCVDTIEDSLLEKMMGYEILSFLDARERNIERDIQKL